MRDTSKLPPELIIADALLFGASDSIERSEAAGQKELVNSECLPTKGSNDPTLTAWGIKFSEHLKDDPLFCNATLPDGWKKVATDHSMWSSLVDNKGNVRASIFYKAAFYDRDAFIQTKTRFRIGLDYDAPKNIIRHMAYDGENKIAFSAEADELSMGDMLDKTISYRQRESIEQEQIKELTEWLNVNRPGWDDPVKSWEIK